MKIAIFCQSITKEILHKDVGQLGEGFRDLGHDVYYITLLSNVDIADDNLIKINPNELKTESFWLKHKFDLVIFYSWLSYKFYDVLKNINKSGTKLIIKADTSGHIVPPLRPLYLRFPGYFENTKDFLYYILRTIQWSFFYKFFVKKKLEQIKFSEFTIIESPKALNNIAYLLYYWGLEDLISKIEFIPNPVCSEINNKNLLTINKENVVISVANFNQRAKNIIILGKALSVFLKIRKDFRAYLIGRGSEKIKKYIQKDVQNRVDFMISQEHKDLIKFYDKAKIFFLPSIWEGSPLTAAEALTRGCSIVGTPLEALDYFCNNGKSGTISSNFSLEAITAALILDAQKWDRNEYNPQNIASFWSEVFDRTNIAKLILSKLK